MIPVPHYEPESERRMTWWTMPSVIADCQTCGYFEDVSGTSASDNARQRAKRHVERSGHTVRIERTITTYLEPASVHREEGEANG